jgi:hypothetical protein
MTLKADLTQALTDWILFYCGFRTSELELDRARRDGLKSRILSAIEDWLQAELADRERESNNPRLNPDESDDFLKIARERIAFLRALRLQIEDFDPDNPAAAVTSLRLARESVEDLP